ncbi:helix-turn-helix transcriptional regulator [Streptomyces canus]|uniref:helix-turn-helix transcriptional regulator n=1 Tax=Streptomyces canus TaxID=58343 RepID=UPI002DDC2C6D|nr:helix-turn-helix transcriptional regulator [Streptomyces canus]WSD87153.1 helix-turn-helix transcriptional regulator [Streptomyces canus]
MIPVPHPEHGVENLCAAGTELYARALREGYVLGVDAGEAPCLLDFGLLHPAVTDLDRLEPVAPAVALHRMLRIAEERIADERLREARLTETFEPLMRIDGRRTGTEDSSMISVLSGLDLISRVIGQAVAAGSELLAVQPNTSDRHAQTPPPVHVEAFDRDQSLLNRGGRIRTLYQHTLRHAPSVVARYERLRGDVEARSLDEVTERLIIVDRTVAFIPATKDRTLALEIRHPALVSFFVTAFDRLWRLATPMYPEAVQQPTRNGITPRQRAIAALLVEGHTDAVIADRLGMNIRTARVHIAKLAATLGSESRAQLGYLIGQSGILGQEDAGE